MPLTYARALTGRHRTARANQQLGCTLAFIAGAINAGGFLAVRQYTSHMTGIVSTMADSIALGHSDIVLSGLGAVVSFLLGAATCSVLVNHARRQQMHSEFALPLLLEACLLLGFGLMGERLSLIEGLFVPATVLLLCFIMGVQNAVITKISNAEIRTTHVTGIVTDLGIELGKLAYWNAPGPSPLPPVRADRGRLRVLSALLGSFFVGGVAGALGFKHLGYVSTVPLTILLVVLAIVPAFDDLAGMLRRPG
ncbi:MAG: DUF1275 domain-containing protein [Pseudomonadota bacterium]|nr:DUF1275 domain-containing protein [Pseudomonadota bacterium]